jgi:ribonuclease Z
LTFSITILGSNSAIPTLKRNPTAQLLNYNERMFLIDCAEGTQLQLRRNHIKLQRISQIFISHLHGDHFFGLIGLISSMHLLGRSRELHVYGPPKLDEIIDIQLKVSETALKFPYYFHPLDPETNEVIFEDSRLMISTIPLKHSIPTCGFLFREKTGKRRIRKQIILDYLIPVERLPEIKDGADFIDPNGKIIKNSEMTDDPFLSRSYAYCSDTAYNEAMIPIIENVDILYHEATFMNDMAKAAAEKFHSTALEAALIAKKANVGKLIIGHYSNRYETVQELVDEAKAEFTKVEAAEDGKVFSL